MEELSLIHKQPDFILIIIILDLEELEDVVVFSAFNYNVLHPLVHVDIINGDYVRVSHSHIGSIHRENLYSVVDVHILDAVQNADVLKFYEVWAAFLELSCH
jgi:hypothetical protein